MKKLALLISALLIFSGCASLTEDNSDKKIQMIKPGMTYQEIKSVLNTDTSLYERIFSGVSWERKMGSKRAMGLKNQVLVFEDDVYVYDQPKSMAGMGEYLVKSVIIGHKPQKVWFFGAGRDAKDKARFEKIKPILAQYLKDKFTVVEKPSDADLYISVDIVSASTGLEKPTEFYPSGSVSSVHPTVANSYIFDVKPLSNNTDILQTVKLTGFFVTRGTQNPGAVTMHTQVVNPQPMSLNIDPELETMIMVAAENFASDTGGVVTMEYFRQDARLMNRKKSAP